MKLSSNAILIALIVLSVMVFIVYTNQQAAVTPEASSGSATAQDIVVATDTVITMPTDLGSSHFVSTEDNLLNPIQFIFPSAEDNAGTRVTINLKNTDQKSYRFTSVGSSIFTLSGSAAADFSSGDIIVGNGTIPPYISYVLCASADNNWVFIHPTSSTQLNYFDDYVA